jgi:hypothetical protein
MANMVIDANVFKAIYEEDIGLPSPRPERTASAGTIFCANKMHRLAFIDDGHQVEQEWRDQCPAGQEWFDAWLAENFANGKIILVNAKEQTKSASKIFQHGFPKSSRDIWYVRIAYAAREYRKEFDTSLITEDIDFFDPTKKKDKNKSKVIKSGSGPIAKHLRNEKIYVGCIASFLAAN